MSYSDAMLQSFRTVADPLADLVIAELAQTGLPIGPLMARLVARPRPDPADLPPMLEAWLDQHAHPPKDVDHVRLARASALWVRRGVTMAMILGTASLVECYAAALGVKALTYSNRLADDTYRRLRESVLWVNLIMLPGGMEEGSEGVRAVWKVRLMHAAIRHLIGRTGRWETEARGVPLCQEDLAGTLMTFSYTVLRSLRRLGIRLTEQEAADYLYFWGVVGEMMGVRRELIPATVSEAEELTTAIYRRQHASSPAGLQMTRAMLATYSRLLPGGVGARFFPAFIRHLSGDAVADLLQVPPSRWAGVVRFYLIIGTLADFGWWAWNQLKRQPPARTRSANTTLVR